MSWRDSLFRTGPRATKPDAIATTFEARSSEARALHASGRMSIERAITHMTGQKATFISVPDADGFMPLAGFASSTMDGAIAASTWFYACVVANARSASDLPAVVQVKDEKGNWQRDMKHPLNDLLAVPLGNAQGWPRWSWKQLAQTVFMQLTAEGNSFLKPATVTDTPAQKRVTALFPIMSPCAVRAIENRTNDIRGPLLGWDLGDGSPQLPIQDLVNIMTPTAGSLWNGISPMAVATKAIETDASANSRSRYNMENKAQPGIVVLIEDEWGTGARATQEAAILAKLAENYTEAAHSGTPIVIGGGAKLQAPPDVKDLQVFDTRKFARDEILAVCQTPPPMIGDYENATLQNFDKAFRSWWMNVLFPLNHDFYGALNSQAVWPIYGTATRLWYDVSRTDIGVMLMDAKLDVAKKILDLGHTANTAAAEVGLDLEFVAELETYNRDLATAGRIDTEPEPDNPAAVTEDAEGAE